MILKNKIIVIGSTNIDMVIKTKNLPKPGETILGGTFIKNLGGKGANQAVAAFRLGGDVVFLTKIGNDIFGQEAKQFFKSEGLDTASIIIDPKKPTGIALITVDDNAENTIVVSSGANAEMLPEDIMNKKEIIDIADFILIQLEIPLETVNYVTEEAFKNKKKVILNPAPAQFLSSKLLENLYLITPNELKQKLSLG